MSDQQNQTDEEFLNSKSLTELLYMQQMVKEAIDRKEPEKQCTCKGFYKDPNCQLHKQS